MSRDEDWFTTEAPDHRPLKPHAPVSYCDTCRMIHAKELSCAVVRARVDAMIIEPGEVLGDEELRGADRVELLKCLRLRGISLEPQGARWLAVATVSA